jgi:hypothetical protein
MAKAEASVHELVGMIQRGELRLPEMQRRYVWKSTRVRDLLDSLYRGYPSGTILLWETDEEVPLQSFSIAQNANPFRTTRLLLDGQQRLTSLSAVIRGEPIEVRGRKRPIELLFNLNHPEELALVTEVHEDQEDDEDEVLPDETEASDDELQRRFDSMAFVVSTRKLERMPHWVKVSEVFKTDADAPFLQAAGIESVSDPRFQQYSQRLARLRGIRRYVYRMDILERGLSYEEVTEVFVRVNSLGAKLRSSDLALAQITAKWRHSLEIFQAFQSECADAGFELDLGLYIKTLIAFATGQSRFKTVGSLTIEALQVAWKESCRGMEFAINFLKENAWIDSPALLSSPFILITVAIYGRQSKYELTPEDAGRLRYWILLANAKGRYSRGSSETLLDQDLASVLRGEGPDQLVDRLRLQVGRLDISPAELEGRNQRSALFKTMFLAFKQAGATDWRSNLTISLDHSGKQHRLQFHHIFPKATLKGFVTDREADDIANLAFIGGGTNRRISNKPPYEYIPPLVAKGGAEPLMLQGIPTDPQFLKVEAYKDFLTERRKNVAHMLNTFLGTDEAIVTTSERSAGPSLSVAGLIERGEGTATEFKSTLRVNLHTGQPDVRMEREVLKSIAAFLNSDGGVLVIGVNDQGKTLGLAADKFANEDKANLHLANLIRDRVGPQHMRFVNPHFEEYDGARVLLVECKKSRSPVFVKDGSMEHFYIRTGAATTELTGEKMQQYIKHRFR